MRTNIQYNIQDNDKYVVFFRVRDNDWWYCICGKSNVKKAMSCVKSYEDLYDSEKHNPLQIIKNGEILKRYDCCHIHTFLSHNYAILNNNTFKSIREYDNYVIYNKYKSNATNYYFIEGASTKHGAERALNVLIKHENECGRNGSEIYEFCSIQNLLVDLLKDERNEYFGAYIVEGK